MLSADRTVPSASSEAELAICQEFRHRNAKVLGWNCCRRHRSITEGFATSKCWRWVRLRSCCISRASSCGCCSASTGAPGADQPAAAALCADFPRRPVNHHVSRDRSSIETNEGTIGSNNSAHAAHTRRVASRIRRVPRGRERQHDDVGGCRGCKTAADGRVMLCGAALRGAVRAHHWQYFQRRSRFAEVLYFDELRCYCGGCEVADSTRWCRPVGRGANRWSRRGLTQPLFWSTEFTTLEQSLFKLSQG